LVRFYNLIHRLGGQVIDINLKNRLILDNPWWSTGAVEAGVQRAARRAFVHQFLGQVRTGGGVAAVLSGPGRAGKTTLIKQVIGLLMEAGVEPRLLVYLRLDNPAFANADLVDLVDQALHASGAQAGAAGGTGIYIFLDDIHNVPDWDVRLDELARARSSCRIVAVTALAPLADPDVGADLNQKSAKKIKKNQGPGPFSHSILPPVLFAEYLHIKRIGERLFDRHGRLVDLDGLNDAFVDYVNIGGFPEVAFVTGAKSGHGPAGGAARGAINPADVTSKILHGDLAGLCGIADQREVAKLMTRLALESGLETSIESLSKDMDVAKNTLRKYLEFLESSYLIKRIWRIDGNAKRFQRQTRFKVYLTSPALRAGLAGPVALEDEAMARLAETAVISQFMHSPTFQRLYYAFWKKGRHHKHVGLVEMPLKGSRPVKCIELDWSNKALDQPQEMLGDMLDFMDENRPSTPSKALTRNMFGKRLIGEHEIGFMPVSVWCFAVGQVLLVGPGAQPGSSK